MSEFEISRLDDPEPWDRQVSESSDEYLAFITYRNLGPGRSYAQTARELGRSPGAISDVATRQRWSERVTAWDFYQDKIFQAEMAEQTRQMARRHVEMAEESLTALRAPVKALLTKLENDPNLFEDAFEVKDLIKLMKLVHDSAKIMPQVMNAERLATNQPTQISEHTENRNLNYSDAERIGEVLDVLQTSGVLASLLGQGEVGEIIDAEAIELDDDRSDSEADGVSAGTT